MSFAPNSLFVGVDLPQDASIFERMQSVVRPTQDRSAASDPGAPGREDEWVLPDEDMPESYPHLDDVDLLRAILWPRDEESDKASFSDVKRSPSRESDPKTSRTDVSPGLLRSAAHEVVSVWSHALVVSNGS